MIFLKNKFPKFLDLVIFSNYKQFNFIFPYMLSRAVAMFLNLWTFAFIINNFAQSALPISRYMIYGFIVDFLRNIYVINYSRIAIKNRDVNNIFSSINLIISLGCSLICGLFIFYDTSSIILPLAVFFITFFIGFDLDVIRANNKNQPINQYLFLIGLLFGIVILLINPETDYIYLPFWVLLQPFLITSIHNAFILFHKFVLINKDKILQNLILENLYKYDYKSILIALLPGFILNAPLSIIIGNNNLLLNFSLVIRIFNLFCSVIPIVNNLSLKGFFEEKKYLFFNNTRVFMFSFQLSFGFVVSIIGFIFLNIFLGDNISVNLYFAALTLFGSFSLFHSRIILPKNVYNSLSSKLQIFYLIFVSTLFYIICRELVPIGNTAILYMISLQSLIFVISSRFITNNK